MVRPVADEDRVRWDARYSDEASVPKRAALPELFSKYSELFPTSGRALDVACGRGAASVWLAVRGLDVLGLDISPVALLEARRLSADAGVDERCRFELVDLDQGLPPGPQADVIMCHMFRDARLDRPLIDRLASGGLLAVVARSQAGAGPGPFRAAPGELSQAFASLHVIAQGEGEGRAWLLGRKQPD